MKNKSATKDAHKEPAKKAAPIVTPKKLGLKQTRTEKLLRESEERLRIAVEVAQMATWDWDLITDEIIWNERHFTLFGMKPTSEPQHPETFFDHVYPNDQDWLSKRLKQAIETNTPFDAEFRIVRSGDDEIRWMEGYGQVIENRNDKPVRMAGVMSDITNRKRAEKLERDKQLLQKLVSAQENERKRIASDLHDELGQQLTALRLKIDQLSKLCEDDVIFRSKIDDIQLIAKRIDDGVDFLSWELRPAALDDFGLYAALNKYIDEWSRYSGVTAELISSHIKKTRYLTEIEINLYRIAQEAMNNIHKHADAKKVEVILEKRDKTIVLIIADDGSGFNPKSKDSSTRGIGIIGMRERAQLIGGNFEIESAPGRGTTIYVRVPVALMETIEGQKVQSK